MLKNLFLAIYTDGNIYDTPDTINIGKALLISLIAILIVFIVLTIIIGAVKLMEVDYKKATANKKAPEEVSDSPVVEEKNTTIEDDDMMVAALIATIDYSNEVKTDVKLKSIKRIG